MPEWHGGGDGNANSAPGQQRTQLIVAGSPDTITNAAKIVFGAGASVTDSGNGVALVGIGSGAIAAHSLFGNPGTAAAAGSAIAVGSGLTLTAGGTLNATGGGGGSYTAGLGVYINAGTIGNTGTIRQLDITSADDTVTGNGILLYAGGDITATNTAAVVFGGQSQFYVGRAYRADGMTAGSAVVKISGGYISPSGQVVGPSIYFNAGVALGGTNATGGSLIFQAADGATQGGDVLLLRGSGATSGNVVLGDLPTTAPSRSGAVWRDTVTNAVFIVP